MDFYEAWTYLENHEMFNSENSPFEFQDNLSVEIVKVNPKTMEIDEDNSKNTLTQVWLETGPISYDNDENEWCKCWDYRLDCGADTFEEAIIKLANKVKQYY